MSSKVTWKAEPDAHDYPAAASYLSLVAPGAQVSDLVEALKAAPIEHFKAKDMLRASGLALLTPRQPPCGSRPGQGGQQQGAVTDPADPW